MNATMIGVPVLSRFAGSVVLRALALMRALDLEAVMCVCVCVWWKGVWEQRGKESRECCRANHMFFNNFSLSICANRLGAAVDMS
jgi:hypothetical protein